jgi:topoisomerase (DNA) II binding protein 1
MTSSAPAARRAATFAGASVFLSRNLVAPEVFDAVHDALRLNGAEVFLCADPGRTGPLDFHVISSPSHVHAPSLPARIDFLFVPQIPNNFGLLFFRRSSPI